MQRSGAPEDIYRSAIFTLQSIIQATVFTFTAQRFLEYAALSFGTAENAIFNPAFWLQSVTWNFVVTILVILAVLVEYVCFASIVSRVPKVRDLAIIISMGLFETWMALSTDIPSQFWLMSTFFFIPILVIYVDTRTFPMLNSENETRSRRAVLRSHLTRQTLGSAAACLFGLCVYVGIRLGLIKEPQLLVITLVYVIVFGVLMLGGTARFIAKWFGAQNLKSP